MIYGNPLGYGLLGAIFMDLMVAGYLGIDDGKIVAGKENGVVSSEVMEKIRQKVVDNSKGLKVTSWMKKLGLYSNRYLKEVRSEMISAGLIRVERKKVLFIPWSLWYPANPGYRKKLIFRVNEILLSGKVAEKDEAMLLGLIYATKLHKALSNEREKRKKLRKALVRYMKDSPVASGTDQVLREIQTAIAAGIVVSVSASNASHC